METPETSNPTPTSPPVIPGDLPVQPSTSGLAITSLVLGILGFCTSGLSGILGLIFGIIALISISKSKGLKKGSGFAIGGIVCSVASFFFLAVFMIGLMLPAFTSARSSAQKLVSQSNARMIATGISIYASENDDALPPLDDWVNVLVDGGMITRDQVCWGGDINKGKCFTMNINLEGLLLSDIQTDPAQTVLFFESELGSPLAGGLESLPIQSQSGWGYIVAFVDGHVAHIEDSSIEYSIWEP